MELYSDAYYIKRIVAGDTGCFACLLDKYSRPVHSLILKMVRSKEDAEELAQDVFMKVFRNLSSFKGDCSFSTWIYRITYNTAISELRRKKQEYERENGRRTDRNNRSGCIQHQSEAAPHTEKVVCINQRNEG